MILFVDDIKQPGWYGISMYNVHHATTYEDAKYFMDRNIYDVIYLDHDLGSISADGSNLLQYYIQLRRQKSFKVVCISWNPIGIERIKAVCEEYNIPFELANHDNVPTIKGQSG